tara:strand:+ start:578 stop:991 length:414 start_codon:yes stop_codon:yes gene_type:complete
VEWEFVELRELFDKLVSQAKLWIPDQVLVNTKSLGDLIEFQLISFNDGKYRSDRNECIGFFDSINKFIETNLPISLDHFEALVKQYRDRISPYPHYSGIKLQIPLELSKINNYTTEDIPKNNKDDDTNEGGTTLKLM